MITLLAFLFKVSIVLGTIVTIIVVVGTALSFIMNLISDFITSFFLFIDNFFIGRK
jgi:uncharacterized membrane protein YczE